MLNPNGLKHALWITALAVAIAVAAGHFAHKQSVCNPVAAGTAADPCHNVSGH